MTKIKVISVLFFLISILSCRGQKANKVLNYYVLKNYTISILNKKYWNYITPAMFIDTLMYYGKGYNFVIYQEPSSCWFDVKSYTKILKLIKDTSKYASIVSSANESRLHFDISNKENFVSVQARYLLLGYKLRRYPPTLCSYHDSWDSTLSKQPSVKMEQ